MSVTQGSDVVTGAAETSVIYLDDNLTALRHLPDASVDLVYLDPPFFSNRVYEVIWGDEAEIRSFEDRWEGGIQVYIDWMRHRLREMHRVLAPTGSIFLHCDPHASHYLKVLMDEIFGGSLFRNEIIWKRTGAHSSAKKFAPVHDTILYFSKSRTTTWTSPRTSYDTDYLDKYYKFDDGDGRLYWRNSLTAAGVRNGSSGQPWRGIDISATGAHWKFTIEKLDSLDAQGRIYWPPGGKGFPQIKRYRDDLQGKAIGDVWTDIDKLNPVSRERLGYPTQKPEALLKRIIEATTTPDQVVLDPFCGCGTAISAAQQLGRRWIGIDISPTAVEIMKRRMRKVSPDPVRVIGEPDTVERLRNLKPFEFQNWVIQRFVGTHSPRKSNDLGIDGYSFMVGHPIQVKRSDSVGRNVIDNFETAMRRGGHDSGYVVAFSFTRNAREEVARARAADGLDINLVTVAQLLEPQLERRIPELASVTELPLPPARAQDALPKASELQASEIAG